MATKWTRATYRAHAEVIKSMLDDSNRDMMKDLAQRLAAIYRVDNANFDKDKFLTACGVDK